MATDATAPRQHTGPQRRVAIISFIAFVVLAGCGLAFTIIALEIQSSSRAYVTGNGLWSKAHIQASYYLTRYSYSGKTADLQQARKALAIPLADRRGRLALDARPPQWEIAREAFLAGHNHPDDIGNIIWLYWYFSDYLFFQDAVEIWREADHYILALDQLVNELEARYADKPVSNSELSAVRQRLAEINSHLRPLDIRFAEVLASGTRSLNRFLLAFSFLVLVIVVVGGGLIFFWAIRNIARSENKFHATFQHAAVGMAQMKPDGSFIDVNDSLLQILHQSRDILLQSGLAERTHPDDRNNDVDDFQALIRGAIDSYVVEKRLLRADDAPVWCKLTLSSIHNFIYFQRYLIVVIEDISEQRRLSSALSYQATHDSLTGIMNRLEFENRLSEALRSIAENNDRHTLCFIDLDQFKVVNDTCGHIAGDGLLRQVTDTISQQLRRGDVLARLGGDEFGVIFMECDISAAGSVAEKVRTALSDASFIWEGATFSITASMGLVEINTATADTGALLKAVDRACYSAKDHGRNQIHIYSEGDLALSERRNEMEWVSRIRNAISENQLKLAAQRIQLLQDPNTVRYELLVRLVDADGGIAMPDTFFPAAERYNIATLIDRWVVDAALRTLKEYPGFLDQTQAIHINLSGQSISRNEFQQYVIDLLNYYALDNEKICFEITETAAISSLIEARRFIDSLRKIGCHFALDDFGSGLSSFGYLRSLPVDMVKIDGSFVRNMDKDDVHREMVRSISEIGRIMNKIIVAEFVESEAVLTLLNQFNVDYAQGYAIHKPCWLDELLQSTLTDQPEMRSDG